MSTKALPPRSSVTITMGGGESSPRTCSGVQSHGRSGVSKKQLWKSCISRGCSTQITQGTRRHSILTRSRRGTRMTLGSIEGCPFPCCGDKPEFVNPQVSRPYDRVPAGFLIFFLVSQLELFCFFLVVYFLTRWVLTHRGYLICSVLSCCLSTSWTPHQYSDAC